MILKVGEYGITTIKNMMTHEEYASISVYQRMLINGIPAVNDAMYCRPILYLGMNAELHFEKKEQADKMLDMINTIMTKGDETEVTIESTLLEK